MHKASMLKYRAELAVVMVALGASWALSGCVSATDSLTPCETQSDCETGETCSAGFCNDSSTGRDPGGRLGRGETDTGSAADASEATALPDVVVNDDTGPSTDAGGSTDVPTRPDTGGGGGTDTGGGGGGGACSSPFATCTVPEGQSIVAAGANYFCANTADGGVCLPACAYPFGVAGCPDDSVCWSLEGEGGDEITACIPSDCTSFQTPAAECAATQSCIEFDDGIGVCLDAGTASVGSPCNISSTAPADNCGPSSFCDTPGEGATRGTCVAFCDFWGSSSCGGGQTCGLLTYATGICQSLTPAGPLEECTTAGDMCGTRARCFTFNTADGEANFCASYCRRGVASDCAGSIGTTCNWNAFRNTSEIGLCLPPCESTADCTGGDTCTSDGVCAQVCTNSAACGAGNICLDGTCKPKPD